MDKPGYDSWCDERFPAAGDTPVRVSEAFRLASVEEGVVALVVRGGGRERPLTPRHWSMLKPISGVLALKAEIFISTLFLYTVF